jgi:type I restriction enzyme S subunit
VEFVHIDDLETYTRVRVQLHAKGIVLRDVVSGTEIKTKKQQVCRAGEFLVAEIDAKVGGFGIVPDDLAGAIVSSHYFLFELADTAIDTRFLDFFIRTPSFQDQVCAQGSTNYAAIRPTDVPEYKIPLPPLDEQRRIVARIEQLAARIADAHSLRGTSLDQAEALFCSAVTHLNFKESAWTTLRSAVLDKEGAVRSGPFGSQLHHEEFVESGISAIGTRAAPHRCSPGQPSGQDGRAEKTPSRNRRRTRRPHAFHFGQGIPR